MVDSERRKNLALNLRRLSVGVITNDEFENNISETVSFGWLPEQYYRSEKAKNDDPVIIPMLELSWGMYSDLKNHKLTGADKLPDESLKIIARLILFLQSDREYEWPRFEFNNPLLKFSFKDFLLSILTFGKFYRDKKRQQEIAFNHFKSLGDYDYWPFFKYKDYVQQLNIPPFLTGKERI